MVYPTFINDGIWHSHGNALDTVEKVVFCNHVFRIFDADKNGSIDFKEFLLAINITSKGTPKEILEYAFKLYDVDGNGRIDEREMSQIILAIYELMGAKRFKPQDTPEERLTTEFLQPRDWIVDS